MKLLKSIFTIAFLFSFLIQNANAKQIMDTTKALDSKQQSIVTISAFMAKGDLIKLKIALSEGLDAGLTINEIKEVIVQLYAYAGFPRSLNALQTFMSVLQERKKLKV